MNSQAKSIAPSLKYWPNEKLPSISKKVSVLLFRPTSSMSGVRKIFWTVVTRGAGGSSSPRKKGISGCIPAEIRSVERSSARGISECEGRNSWPFDSKNARKPARSSAVVRMGPILRTAHLGLHLLMVVCPSCGRENPEGFAFCGYCTAPLAERKPAQHEERKIVSVLFCDLVGFTAASEQQDPEDVRARIRPYHARLRQEIERYGGTVEKFVGDAVMAAFGAPVGDGFRTPFVGRELERPLLIGIFERAAQQRSVQLVTVVGEPGVGKTRLSAELGGYVDAKPGITRWRQGRCLPYGEGITFWALGEIVKAEAGILESDSAEVAVAKLEAAVSPEEPERQWLLQRLAPLVGVEAASPAERQELFTAWRRFLEGLAADCATVLVFDDLHWADEALLDFLEHLAEWSQGVPLLVLCAARPELYERRPGWGAGQRNAHTINLSPLSDPDTAEIVAHLIRTAFLSAELEQ